MQIGICHQQNEVTDTKEKHLIKLNKHHHTNDYAAFYLYIKNRNKTLC